MIDYDVNLCILEVDKEDLSEPFVPVSFKSNFKIDDNGLLIWLTNDRRFIKTIGRIENPDVRYNSKTGTGFLYYQLSTETPPGGYSEPVYMAKQVIGLVESYYSEKQLSTLMPADIIVSFLARASKNPYVSVPKTGFMFVPLQDPGTRKFYKLPQSEKRGVLISDVYDFGSGSKELKNGDVLLEFSGYDIDPMGAVRHKELGNLLFCYLFWRDQGG